ncbi:MAG: hypothetical protein K0R28_1710, partial [Paenibacillus sp.]|nr:hypothetical protein [Paenibacillus sp.]
MSAMFAVAERRNSGHFLENPVEVGDMVEPYLLGDRLHFILRLLEPF